MIPQIHYYNYIERVAHVLLPIQYKIMQRGELCGLGEGWWPQALTEAEATDEAAAGCGGSTKTTLRSGGSLLAQARGSAWSS
jgi:hypothetical protein